MLISHVLRDKGGVVHALPESASIEQAAKELHLRKVGALVILNEAGNVTGVLSERDVVREVARRGVDGLTERVSAAMTRTVVTASPLESIDDGLGRMTDRRIRHLPVLDEGGHLIGIVSIGDLVKHRIAVVEAEAAAMQAYISAS